MDILYRIIDYVINPLIYLLIGVAVIYFLFGVFKFVANADNSDERVKGGQHIFWGIIGLAVMVSVFALVNLILSTLGPAGVRPDTLP